MGFKASLGYIGSSRLPWITRNTVLKSEKKVKNILNYSEKFTRVLKKITREVTTAEGRPPMRVFVLGYGLCRSLDLGVP